MRNKHASGNKMALSFFSRLAYFRVTDFFIPFNKRLFNKRFGMSNKQEIFSKVFLTFGRF